MRIRVVAEGEYEIPEGRLKANYGTTDPVAALAIDQEAAEDDVETILATCDDVKITLSIVEEES